MTDENFIIKDDICKECGGICCQGKVSGYAPCGWLTPTGCNMCDKHRNPTCNIWPYVIVDDRRFPNSRRIFLDTGCPHWREFVKHYDKLPKEERLQDYSLVIMKLSVHDIEDADPRREE